MRDSIKTMPDKIRKAEMNQYNSVTEGDLLRAFVLFLLPLIAAGCLQQSYTIADGLILGNAINQEALGSVSSVGPIIDVCTLIQIGMAGGCSIMVSHLYGAQNHAALKKLIPEIRNLITLISVIIAAVAFIFAPWILRRLHTPDELMAGAVTYMRICFAGVPFMSLYSLQAGILRGMGDSRRPLGGIAVSSGVNIALDLLFVVAFDFGIAGAAIATASAEALSALYLYIKLGERVRSLGDRGAKESGDTLECIRLGAPQMIQSVVTSGGKVLLQNLTNMLGTAVVIGVAAAFKIDSLLLLPLISISTAVSVFSGQNIGAGHDDRVRSTLRYGMLISLAFSLVLSVFLWKFGYPLTTVFGLDRTASEAGYRYLLLCVPFYWVFGVQFVVGGYLNGAKHTTLTSAAAIAGLAVRLLFAYIFCGRFGADVLPLGEALSWVTAAFIDICGALYYRSRQNHSIL